MPLLLDLFCGRGGWTAPALAAGWECWGVDQADLQYPGHFIQATLPCPFLHHLPACPDLCLISPPCEEFARYHLPWIKGPPPSLALLRWSIDFARKVPFPCIVECSRFAGRHIPPVATIGNYALWGSVPALLPYSLPKRKMRHPGQRPDLRAVIEPDLAGWIIHLHSSR